MSSQGELAPSGDTPTYNAYTGKGHLAQPGETPAYNPCTSTWELYA